MRCFLLQLVWFWGVLPIVSSSLSHRRLITYEETGVEGRYIVLLKKNDEQTVSNDNHRIQDTVRERYANVAHEFDGTVIQGFTIENANDEVLEDLLQDDAVQLIEQDQVVRGDFVLEFFDDVINGRNPFSRYFGGGPQNSSGGDAVSWGLDRINQRALPLDGNTYTGPYTGAGVDVYILDSGLRTTHKEFEGRASCSLNVVNRQSSQCSDGTGHGTHVAGVIGGRTYGVAPGVRLLSVKVLDDNGEGYSSWVIEALEHVVAQTLKTNRPVVVNLSLGAKDSQALNAAVDAAAGAGVVFVVSAGNEGINACQKAPAGSEMAITVASLEADDKPSSFSNYGKCVNIFAPGASIVSASGSNDDRSRAMTGTSQAAPHVAGVAALILEREPDLPPADVWQRMRGASSGSVVSMGLSLHQFSGSPNRVVRVP